MAVNWTSGLLSGYGLYDQLDRFSNISDKAVEGTNQLADQAIAGTQFKPFTVTTGTGTAQAGADGSLNLQNSPEAQARIDSLFGGSGMFFDQAQQGTAGREQDIFNRIRATQMPEEARAQTQMNDRLSAMGRSGIRSADYGGTPEQLAYHKAVQESQNNASLMALQQGQAEQLQQANLGGMFQNAGYLPQAQMLNAVNPGINIANMGQAGQIAGQNMAGQLGLGGLQTSLNADVGRANLIGNAMGAASSALSGSDFDPVGDAAGGLWDWLTGQFGGGGI